MKMTGCQIILECLKNEGVDTVFGYPGGAVLDLYDELTNHSEINHILVRHEQGAAHAADGYARATGKVGVCLVTSGPGATNTVTGIATAYCDSIPMVIFTGQVHTHLIGNDAFQEVDIVGITRSCTKHNYLVKDIDKLALTIKQAFHLARSGRPGPVLVDLPKDMINQKFEFDYPESVTMRSYNPTIKPNPHQIRKTVDNIIKAKSPLLLIGGGAIIANAHEEVRTLAKEYAIPVTSTLMGLGAYPGNDPLFFGMLGMHGTYAANMAVSNADLIIAVGARFDDRVTGSVKTFAKKAKIIHIDIDPTSIRKNIEVDVPVVGDCKFALMGILEELAKTAEEKPDYSAWLEKVNAWQKEHPLAYVSDEKEIKPQEVIEAIEEITKGDAIYVTEVGQHQMWAAQFLTITEPRTFLTSGGLGTMGYGLPASIGAQKAHPDKLVINIAGDGSIQMNSQEFMTAVSQKLPVKVVILNNTYLGMVRQWQELFYKKNYSSTPMDAQPDFKLLAEAYGAEGYRVTKKADLVSTLKKAFASPHTAIIDVQVSAEENVYPMVPAGGSLTDMLLLSPESATPLRKYRDAVL